MLLLLLACSGAMKNNDPGADDPGADTGDALDDSPADSPTDTGPFDADRDGATAAVDCDEGDADIHPGADEYCDGVDNDCDGSTDEQAADVTAWYPDGDGDGWGGAEGAVYACAPEDGYRAEAGDCDDGAAGVNPAAAEVCDGIDQDCDGAADDGVPTDGAGCQDPGWPIRSEIVDTVQIVLRTHIGSSDGSDEPLVACLSDAWCFGMDIADWDDRAVGRFDVHTFEGVGMGRSEFEEVRLYSTSGDDRWRPAGVSVTLDGEAAYTRMLSDVYIGDAGGLEVMSWDDPAGLYDDTIWESPLTHGPILGAPTSDGAAIWLRTDRTRRVGLRVAQTAEALAAAPVVAWRYPSVEHDFAERIAVQGLGADTQWWYNLEIDGVIYGPWSVRTAPVRGVGAQYRISFGSCAKDTTQPIFAYVRQEAPDLFLFIGDNHYGNTGDLGAQRQNYRWVHERDERREMMAESGILATWDDHDYVDNDEDGAAVGKGDALRAFTEYWANGSYGTDTTAGVFSAHSYGDVDIILIDDRYWRGLEGSITGDAQEQWLIDTVAASTATFKLIASGSQWSLEGTGDSWAEYPAAQARVVDALSAVPGVVLLSGDVHYPEFEWIPAAGYTIPEITSSPLAYPDRANYFISIDIDTAVADPTLTARLIDDSGAEVNTWHHTLSSLTP